MGLLSLLSLSLLLFPLVSSFGCPVELGWSVIGRGCFKIKNDEKEARDHLYARYDCQAEGNNVDLATIPDQTTNDKLHEMIMNTCKGDYMYGGAHIGLMVTPGYYDGSYGNDYSWHNTGARYRFMPWAEPDHYFRCGKLSTTDKPNGKWYTHHCSTGVKVWICEYKVTNYVGGLPEDLDPNEEM